MTHACTFFGHRDAGKEVEPVLRATLTDLIENRSVTLFCVGNQGGFDNVVEKTLRSLKAQDHRIRQYTVLAYLPQDRQEKPEPDTLFPEGLEFIPKKYAVAWRNRWMIEHADIVIIYVKRPFGGAARFKEVALKKGKEVVELADPVK